ncbi:Protein SOK1 [Ceratocystis fimbriata CBS 114723]|uniref:Protein SOK1 n=1 Tax=Ceratocystis fimbriata CBS 114723 TaxID=1035309 RepID=A0A2C5X050_9PEZI|nr:Protein SOK1 [Ceratocystis fimbriata CBS 114723]
MASEEGAGGGMENTKGKEPEVQTTVKSQANAYPISQIQLPRHFGGSPPAASASNVESSQSNTPVAISRANSPSKTSSKSSSSSDSCLEPPVTRHTLVELDVNRIVLNSRLRHDINFDPELHFRPNMDGDKGRKKNQRAEQFWQALEEQLGMFLVNRPAFVEKFGESNNWCLPNLLKAVKEIIQTLVPSRDRQSLDECFNLELLMQQFNHGVADLEKLASWLASLLKSHCAPMRDDWVDDMYNLLSKGNRENDIKTLVKGMRDLLSVLEAMKLDVANHQIRCLRPSLIEDTVKFEKRYFEKKILSDRLDVAPARSWFHNVRRYSKEFVKLATPAYASHVRALGDLAILGIAMAQMTMPILFAYRFPTTHSHHHHQTTHTGSHGQYTTIPPTFMHDEERIHKFREEISEMTALAIVMRLYDKLLKEFPKKQKSDVPSYLSSSMDVDFDFNSPPTSRPPSVTLSGSDSASSSPRSSPRASLVFAAPARQSTLKESRDNVYQSLVDLLRMLPSSQRNSSSRWDAIAPMWALQIVRNTSASLDKVDEIENTFKVSMSTLTTPVAMQVQMDIFQHLAWEIMPRLRDFRGMKAWHLFTNGTAGRPYAPSRGVTSSPLQIETAGIAMMATKIAHVATLHYQVWASVYAGVSIQLPVSTEAAPEEE